jgi:hypothetical protein
MHGQSSGTDRFLLRLFASSMPIRYYDFPCGSSQADQGGISWLAVNMSSIFASSTIRLYFLAPDWNFASSMVLRALLILAVKYSYIVLLVV